MYNSLPLLEFTLRTQRFFYYFRWSKCDLLGILEWWLQYRAWGNIETITLRNDISALFKEELKIAIFNQLITIMLTTCFTVQQDSKTQINSATSYKKHNWISYLTGFTSAFLKLCKLNGRKYKKCVNQMHIHSTPYDVLLKCPISHIANRFPLK